MRNPFAKLLREEDLATLREVAQSNLKRPHDQLRRWWCKKYQLPAHCDLFTQLTWQELWVEFFEDFYEANPAATIKKGEDVQFVTEDPEINELEERLAKGDMTEEEIEAHFAKWTANDADRQAPSAETTVHAGAPMKRNALLLEAYARAEQDRLAAEMIGDGFSEGAPGR